MNYYTLRKIKEKLITLTLQYVDKEQFNTEDQSKLLHKINELRKTLTLLI